MKIKESTCEFIWKEFLTILSDGEPHSIKDLLDHFQLSNSSAGREKLRGCIRKISQVDGVSIEKVKSDKFKGWGFQLIVSDEFLED